MRATVAVTRLLFICIALGGQRLRAEVIEKVPGSDYGNQSEVYKPRIASNGDVFYRGASTVYKWDGSQTTVVAQTGPLLSEIQQFNISHSGDTVLLLGKLTDGTYAGGAGLIRIANGVASVALSGE